jgi:hypothetical protein
LQLVLNRKTIAIPHRIHSSDSLKRAIVDVTGAL